MYHNTIYASMFFIILCLGYFVWLFKKNNILRLVLGHTESTYPVIIISAAESIINESLDSKALSTMSDLSHADLEEITRKVYMHTLEYDMVNGGVVSELVTNMARERYNEALR